MLAAAALAATAVIVVYILIGYPILLALVGSRREPRAIRKDLSYRPTVSVVMAVHNGEKFLRKKLDVIRALRYPAEIVEILVVSDGSTDDTDEIARSYADRGVRLVRVPRGGKAAALNAGVEEAAGEIVFFTDVRQALDPDALTHLVANFADPEVCAVTGEMRFLNPASAGPQADLELYWRYELWARSLHSQLDSLFNTTGCIYAMRRSLIDPLPPDTLTDDAILPLRAFFRGYRVVFEPKALAYDYPTADGGEFRRKVRTLAGLWQVHVRLPQLFSRANRMRFHFLSHKFGRLVLPWAMLAVVVSTLALNPSPFRSFLLTDDAVFLALALLDSVVPRKFPLKRLSSPAKSFLSMNAAALLSTVVFFVKPAILWRPTEVSVRQEATGILVD